MKTDQRLPIYRWSRFLKVRFVQLSNTYMPYEIPPNSQGSFCAGCKARIFWAKTEKGKWIPLDTDKSPHWKSCPVSARFRKPKTKEQP